MQGPSGCRWKAPDDYDSWIVVRGIHRLSYFGVSVFWAFIAASLFFGSIPSLIAYDSKRLDHQIVFLLVLSFLSFLFYRSLCKFMRFIARVR